MSQAVTHYERNRAAYREIDERLSDVNSKFFASDIDERKRMLLRSVEFALISVQTPLGKAERAYSLVAETDDYAEIRDALKSVNYNNQKFDYIKYNREEATNVDEIVFALERFDLAEAQSLTANTFKGVGIVKAGFAIAMLGFKDCMCTDTNVIQSVDFEVKKSYNNIEEYNAICEKIMDYHKPLSEKLSNFMTQWVLFDVMRERGVAYHAEFFHTIMDGVDLPKQSDLASF